jgi:hypothetical protein
MRALLEPPDKEQVMKIGFKWCWNVAVLAFVFGCGSEGEDLSSTAQQAIKQLEAADAEAVRACEAKAEGCRAESGEQEQSLCVGLQNSCQSLLQRLAQVRAEAVACWQRVAECQGDACQDRAEACRQLGESVAQERQPVIDCGGHVQACMLQAAESGQHQMAELCGEMEAACGTGVVEAAVERVRVRAQELAESGEATQSQTQQGEGEPSQEPAGEQVQEGAGEPSQEPAGEQVQEGAGEPSQEPAGEQVQEGAGEPSQEPAGEQVQEGQGEPSADALQQRQQSCLDAIAACGESAGKGEADPEQLRQSGQACDLSVCES